MNNPLVQLALMALTAFGLLHFLAGNDLGYLVVVAITFLAAFSAVLLYLMRYAPSQAEALYQIGGVKQIINLICKLANRQPPVRGLSGANESQSIGAGAGTSGGSGGGMSGARGATASAAAGASAAMPNARAKSASTTNAKTPPAEIKLQNGSDIGVAKNSFRAAVRGHDAACDLVFDHLERNIVLRQRQLGGTTLPPLGCFLMAGSPGIGKRFFATALAQLLYAGKGIVTVDLRDFPSGDGVQQSLASSKQDSGGVLAAVRARPYQVIVFENIECADRRGVDLLTNLIGSGTCRDESTNGHVSFQNCVIFLTTTKCMPMLSIVKAKRLPKDRYFAEVRDALATDTSLGDPLFTRLGEVIVLDDPTPIVRAEVVALLMQRECRRFDVRLDYIDPRLLADEVAHITDAHGFEPVPGRVTEVLRNPLYRASKLNSKRLVLDNEGEPNDGTAPADVAMETRNPTISSSYQ